MTLTGILASPVRQLAAAREETYVLTAIARQQSTIAAIKEGVEDIRAGRVESWTKVRREFGL